MFLLFLLYQSPNPIHLVYVGEDLLLDKDSEIFFSQKNNTVILNAWALISGDSLPYKILKVHKVEDEISLQNCMFELAA